MFGRVGPMELLLIFLVLVLLFGGKKIPEIAKGLGKGIRDFKSSLNGEDAAEQAKNLNKPEQKPPQEPPKS